MLALLLASAMAQPPDWLEIRGGSGPGSGKRVVLLSGDEEYRSEEALPQLAKILARRHGFTCTVIFSINGKGEIDPTVKDNEPGIEALDRADLCIMLLRFRQWPDSQMAHFARYYLAGKPILALRTSTHAFDYPAESSSLFRRFSWNSREWEGGFGRHALGETWVSHWGEHGTQGTRGVAESSSRGHPILRGVGQVFCTSDVYEAHPPADARILMRGRVTTSLAPDSLPIKGRRKTAAGVDQDVNDPMMPVLWVREAPNESGRRNRIVTCTMGAATDLLNEGLRRIVVNGAYWATGLEKKIPKRADVDFVGPYRPSAFGFGGFRRGVKPSDLERSDPDVSKPHGIAVVLKEKGPLR